MTRLLAILPALAALAALGLVLGTTELGPIARGIGLACALASIVVGLVARRADVRVHGASVLAVGTVTAAGQARAGWPYAVAAIAFVLVTIAVMRVAGGRGSPFASVALSATRRAGIVVFVVAAVVACALVAAIPPVGVVVERKIVGLVGAAADGDETGFSTTMTLGSTAGMLKSDRLVLRVYGEEVDYLRGAVYDYYDGRAWKTSLEDHPRTVPAAAPPGTAATRIEFARGAGRARGRDKRWFLPRGACELGTESTRIVTDDGAIGHPAQGDPFTAVWFRSCPQTRGLAPPRYNDLLVSTRLRAQLEPLARTWTADTSTDRDKLDAIASRLKRYGYSLSVARRRGVDPIVDFLTEHKEGHCEHFASAMTLLARSAGIPARVVSGYRVTERNTYGDWSVVRDRNAHAWVEAWVDGEWRSYDPTPVVESMAPRSKDGWADAVDMASRTLDRALDHASRIGPVPVSLAVLLLASGWLAAGRALRALRSRRRSGAKTPDAVPLPAFVALEAAVVRAGHPRNDSEPLEAWAARLRASTATWGRRVGDAVERYAALRYGSIGETPAVERELADLTRRVHSDSQA